MLWTVTKNLLRVGLPLAAIKVTYDKGVWDSSTLRGSQLYERMKEYVVPGLIEYPKQLPTPEEMKVIANNSWNWSVQSVFRGIENLPDLACRTVSKVKSKLGI